MTESVWETPTTRIWQWVMSGVDRGMTATAALRDYRAAGMKIRDSTWYSSYKSAFNLYGIGESIRAIPTTYTIGAQWASESVYDWGERWIMQMKVKTRHPETGQLTTRWVTAESEQLLTRGNWTIAAQEAIDGTPGSIPGIIERVLEYRFYERRF